MVEFVWLQHDGPKLLHKCRKVVSYIQGKAMQLVGWVALWCSFRCVTKCSAMQMLWWRRGWVSVKNRCSAMQMLWWWRRGWAGESEQNDSLMCNLTPASHRISDNISILISMTMMMMMTQCVWYYNFVFINFRLRPYYIYHHGHIICSNTKVRRLFAVNLWRLEVANTLWKVLIWRILRICTFWRDIYNIQSDGNKDVKGRG